MNDILQLKGHFEHKKNSNRPKGNNLPRGKNVSINKLVALRNNLADILVYWENDKFKISP